MLTRNRSLDDLDPAFRPLAFELIARITAAKIAIMIVETRRSEAAHQEDLASGASNVKRSKHQDGLAIDLAPYARYGGQSGLTNSINWNAGPSPDNVLEPYATMGRIGEALGLRWGGRWHEPFDAGHFELVQ